MKRNLFLAIICAALLGTAPKAFGWGREGHATVAYIAECNLTPEAKAKVESILGNHSIVYYASWLDFHRVEHKSWDKRAHTCFFDINTRELVGRPHKDLTETIDLLSNYRELTDSALHVNLYALLHEMGDFHCPGHIYYSDDGGKTLCLRTSYKVRLLDDKNPIKYHKIWDSGVLNHNHATWGYMDYGHILLSGITEEQKAEITKGTLADWLMDSERCSRIVYELVPKPDDTATFEELPHVDRNMLNRFDEVACSQMLKAGLRLAAVLNRIFGE